MKTTSNDQPGDNPRRNPEDSDNPPSPSESLAALVKWLRHYWDIPREKSKWTEAANVILTLLIAIAAFWSAWIFQGQLNEARKATDATLESFHTDERAWVEIEPIKPILLQPRDNKFGAAFKYEIYLKNAGKTAAHDIAVKAESSGSSIELGAKRYEVGQMQDKYLLDKFTESGTGKPIHIPNNPVPKVLAPGAIATVPFTLSGQEPQIFPKTEMVSYLIGRIDYTDEFRVKHWLKFCFFVVNARGELWNCQEGNDEDRNPEFPMGPALHNPN